MRLFERMPGRAAAPGSDLDDRALRAYGETLARLGIALRGFFHPRAGRSFLWDTKNALGLRPLVPSIPDPRHRAIVDGLLDRYEQRVTPAWPRLRSQVIHGDFALDNALLDDRDRVVGIIDFGDIVHSALATDLASLAVLRAAHPPRGRRLPRSADPDRRLPVARRAGAARARAAPRPAGGAALHDRVDQRLAGDQLPGERRVHPGVGSRFLDAAEPVRPRRHATRWRRAGRRAAAGRQRRAREAPPAGAGLGHHGADLLRAGARAARRGPVAVRRRRPQLPRRLQQRPRRRPLPPARWSRPSSRQTRPR